MSNLDSSQMQHPYRFRYDNLCVSSTCGCLSGSEVIAVGWQPILNVVRMHNGYYFRNSYKLLKMITSQHGRLFVGVDWYACDVLAAV